MKFTNHFTAIAVVLALMTGLMACNEKPKKDAAATASPAIETLKICYVDGDSLLNNYNLAKDINEAMLRHQNKYDAAENQRRAEITKFASAMEQKYKNNGYLNEESVNADNAKLQKMQNDAQNYLAGLQQTIQNEMTQSQIQLQDSIENFMKVYAKKKGFDMVLNKSAVLYIDPKYDVTDEVIEGLNKRYNKVEKK
ncbi:MAG: OmpH family outer membrane protein [Muribaculaceae bacterium]|nr:OmpH family outer membrane protein [Muribaculaceae bacterium]